MHPHTKKTKQVFKAVHFDFDTPVPPHFQEVRMMWRQRSSLAPVML